MKTTTTDKNAQTSTSSTPGGALALPTKVEPKGKRPGPLEHLQVIADQAIRNYGRCRLISKGTFGPDRLMVEDIKKKLLSLVSDVNSLVAALEVQETDDLASRTKTTEVK